MIDSHTHINISQEFQSGFGPLVDGAYVFPDAQYEGDLDYLWDLGFRKVRIAGQSWNGFQPIIDLQNTAALKAKERGFHVSYGMIQFAGAKPSDWAAMLVAQNTHIHLMQDLECVDVYYIGNENEALFNLGRDPIVSMSRTSNVVTVELPLPHSMATGDGITYYNAATGNGSGSTLGVNSNSNHNSITVINETTFSFPSTGTDGSTTIGWIQYTSSTVRRLMKRQATALKADGITIPLSYSCIQGIASAQVDGYYIKDFVTLGRGDLDYVDLNVYGTQGFPVAQTLEHYFNDFKRQIEIGAAGFGADHFRVTEWSANSQTTSIEPTTSTQLVYYQMKRLEYLQNADLDNYVFCYRQNAEGGAFPATKPYNSTTQTWRDWWYPFIGGQIRQPTIESSYSVAGTMTPIYSLRESPLALVDANMGFNMGQYQQSGVYVAATVAADLVYLWDLGVRRLRIASGDPLFAAGVTACRNLALAAKAQGFYVLMVNNTSAATDANWESTIIPQTEENIAWAESNGMDEFNMFNELDYRETTSPFALTNSVDKQIALATTLMSEYPDIILSTALAQSSMDYLGAPDGWIEQEAAVNALGLKLTYNVYGDNGDFEQFKERIDDLLAVYPDLRISEWNINSSWSAFPASEEVQNEKILEKLQFLMLRELIHFFFTWSWEHQNDQFALKKADGTLRVWKNVLLENPYPRQHIPIARGIATGRLIV